VQREAEATGGVAASFTCMIMEMGMCGERMPGAVCADLVAAAGLLP
jgi:hypothetical protein